MLRRHFGAKQVMHRSVVGSSLGWIATVVTSPDVCSRMFHCCVCLVSLTLFSVVWVKHCHNLNSRFSASSFILVSW